MFISVPVSSSLCTGVPKGKTNLCLDVSWNVGSGIHRVVAVRKHFIVGRAETSGNTLVVTLFLLNSV